MTLVERSWANGPVRVAGSGEDYLYRTPSTAPTFEPTPCGYSGYSGSLEPYRQSDVIAARGAVACPDPLTIEAQKASYARALDAKLQEGSRLIVEQAQQQKAQLRAEMSSQSAMYNRNIDKVAAGIRKSLDVQTQRQVAQIHQTALQWKSMFELPIPQIAGDALSQAVAPQLQNLRAAESQRISYARGLDMKVQEGQIIIETETQQQKARLERATWEQKTAYAAQLEQAGNQISIQIDQLAQRQHMQLYEQVMHQKSMLEQQACGLAMEYLHQEMQAKLMQNQIDMELRLRTQMRILELETASRVQQISNIGARVEQLPSGPPPSIIGGTYASARGAVYPQSQNALARVDPVRSHEGFGAGIGHRY